MEQDLINENMGLVVHLVKSFRPKNQDDFNDYVQLGLLGLLKAIRKHNVNKGQLSTLAWKYIRWEIMKYVHKPHQITNYRGKESSYTNQEDFQDYMPATLNKVEEKIIKMRTKGYTFKEIGDALGGYTKGWANKLYKVAINKIRDANGE